MTMQAAASDPLTNSPTNLLALLGQAAQTAHDLLGLGGIYKASAEGRDAHARHRIRQDLRRCSTNIPPFSHFSSYERSVTGLERGRRRLPPAACVPARRCPAGWTGACLAFG